MARSDFPCYSFVCLAVNQCGCVRSTINHHQWLRWKNVFHHKPWRWSLTCVNWNATPKQMWSKRCCLRQQMNMKINRQETDFQWNLVFYFSREWSAPAGFYKVAFQFCHCLHSIIWSVYHFIFHFHFRRTNVWGNVVDACAPMLFGIHNWCFWQRKIENGDKKRSMWLPLSF